MASSAGTSKSTNSRQRDRKDSQGPGVTDVSEDLMDYLKKYARENPEKAALWCLGIGFILGWKLKPW
jgi:hypothetical protein